MVDNFGETAFRLAGWVGQYKVDPKKAYAKYLEDRAARTANEGKGRACCVTSIKSNAPAGGLKGLKEK